MLGAEFSIRQWPLLVRPKLFLENTPGSVKLVQPVEQRLNARVPDKRTKMYDNSPVINLLIPFYSFIDFILRWDWEPGLTTIFGCGEQQCGIQRTVRFWKVKVLGFRLLIAP